ncbi:unnamed protein product, partial [Choristocarpus tenellus]
MASEVDTSMLMLSIPKGPPTADTRAARLDVMKGGSRIDTMSLGSRDVTILGRNSRMAHEVLDHQTISRRHAAVVHDGLGGVFAVDLGSMHGTYVSGVRIQPNAPKRLKEGEILKFGESSRSYILHLQPTEAKDEIMANGIKNALNSGEMITLTPNLGTTEAQKTITMDMGMPPPRLSPKRKKLPQGHRNATPVEEEAERQAMLAGMLPLSFGATRDKPLGKKADRAPQLPPAARAAVGEGKGVDHDPHASTRRGGMGGVFPESVGDSRRRREAEIAAITADLMRDREAKVNVSATPGEGLRATEQEESDLGRGEERGGGMSGHGSSGSRGQTRLSNSELGHQAQGEGRGSDEDEVDEEEEEEEELGEEEKERQRVRNVIRRLSLPVSHEVKLNSHTKGVTALALDRAGGRVATGSNDFKVRM